MLDEITQGSLATLAIAILLRALAKLLDSISKALAERATSKRLDSQAALASAEARRAEAETQKTEAENTGRQLVGYRDDARTERHELKNAIAERDARIFLLEEELDAARTRVEQLQRALMSGGVEPPSKE